MVTMRITADVPSNRQLTITLPPDFPLGETELEIRATSQRTTTNGVPASEIRGIAAGNGSPPDDVLIREWIGQHRVEKSTGSAEVRVTVDSEHTERERSRAEALDQFLALAKASSFHSSGPYPTRTDLHERH